jgi:exosome complex component RRP41
MSSVDDIVSRPLFSIENNGHAYHNVGVDKMQLYVDGKRVDGRAFDVMRPLEGKVGVLKNAEGSAMFRIGNTIAIAGVFGPRRVFPKHQEQSERAILRVKYNMAPFSASERIRPGTSRRSTEISMVIREALMPVMFLEEFPKTAIDVHVEVLQADASTRCAALNAASLALVDAGISMKDLVSSCAAGKIPVTDENGNKTGSQLLLDIAGKEDTEGEVDFPVAYYKKKNEITLLQMDGITDKDEMKELLELAKKGCEEIYQEQKSALKRKYLMEQQSEEVVQ